ncbi:class III signal peptide-containing protein [Thermococcus peptonophilus]|uniref:class III signal peptide-containing protein n=1 Tax=Thermococcus peptonophilus TaxID=53952 RepID=UPI0009EE33CF
MFRLKRRKGQGAIEYLFMIAAALVIILIAVRYVSQSGSQASQQGNLAQLQSQVETIKAQLQAQNKDLTSITIPYNATTGKYDPNGGSTATFDNLYKDCMKESNTISALTSEQSCQIIIDWWNSQ